MKVGFTGTRNGMTEKVKLKFAAIIQELTDYYGFTEFHHGDCVGADDDAHKIIEQINKNLDLKIQIHIHPPIVTSLQAKNSCDKSYPAKTYLARNRDIVDAVDVMVGCPPTNHVLKRGGTWYTINYTKKKGVELYIIYPNGEVEHVFFD